MAAMRRLVDSWDALPVGARAALDQQWGALAAGGLPCGAAVVHADGRILATGRNRAYDPPGGVESHARFPLEHTRLAHAELNALALPRTRDQLLRAAGAAPESIATVILTHLHWDHFDLEGWLPRATFWVQRRELEFWTGAGGRDPWIRRFISDCFAEDLAALRSGGRLRTIEGNVQPVDGIRLELVGGHSPGMQIVVVDTVTGPFVIANDALTTYRNLRDWAPPAIHLNSIAECMQAMGRIRDLAHGDEGRMCPGHDGEVCRRFPEITPGVYRLA